MKSNAFLRRHLEEAEKQLVVLKARRATLDAEIAALERVVSLERDILSGKLADTAIDPAGREPSF